MNRTIVSVSMCIGACVMGCEGSLLDLGQPPDGGAGAPLGAASSNSGASSSDLDAACPPAQPGLPASDASTTSFAPLLGAWTGYAENAQFSGGGAVHLVFTTAADGSVAGTITFGSAPAPAPPTDPNVGYEPNGIAPVGTRRGVFVEGFPYTMFEPSFDGARLRFSAVSIEPYKAWCELETPIATGSCRYNCVASSYSEVTTDAGQAVLVDESTGKTFEVDYAKWLLCNSPYEVCSCTAAGCTIPEAIDLTVDVRLSPGKLDGSLDFGSGLAPNVHLTGPGDASP